MTPNEIYARPVERVDNVTALMGTYYNHVPELLSQDDLGMIYELEDKAPRVEIRYVKEFYFDHSRVWRLAGVWFKPENYSHFIPIMVIQNAGRGGDDHDKRFITNLPQFRDMIKYLSELLPVAPNMPDEYNPTDTIPGLDRFYNHSLDGHFEKAKY